MKQGRLYLTLHILLLLFSFAPVCSKLAGLQPVFSGAFFVYYGISIGILGVYALAWQQVIKRMPLTAAYANRAVTVVWGLVWGGLFFGEKLSPLKILAALIIVGGVVLYALAQGEEAGEDA